MQFIIVYLLFWILLVQNSFSRVLKEINHSDEFDFKNRRGVTYIKPPSMPHPDFPNDDFNYTPERSNRAKLKYDIFERADERPGAKLPNTPVNQPSQPSAGQLPPQKFGPVLFPDEEAATGQNNGNKDNGEGGQNNQKGGTSGSLTNPSQDQRKNPDSENRNNNGNKQKEDARNQNVGNSNDGTNRPQDHRNRYNGSSNTGRDHPGGRRNCSPFSLIFCRMW